MAATKQTPEQRIGEAEEPLDQLIARVHARALASYERALASEPVEYVSRPTLRVIEGGRS